MSTPESNLRVANLVIEDLGDENAALRAEVVELQQLVVVYRWMCLAMLDWYVSNERRLERLMQR